MSDELKPREPRWRAFPRRDPLGASLLALIVACGFIQALAQLSLFRWGLSAEAIREGRWATLFTHMFLHGGVMHLFFNSTALVSLSPAVSLRLPPSPRKPLIYFGLYLICGLAGGAAFLALNPDGQAPAVGASGAICGLWGASARLGPYPGRLTPLFSRPMFQQVQAFTVMNLVLIALMWMLSGGLGGGAVGGIAWEAHLGGFIAGLVLAPWAVRLAGDPAR